MNMPQVEPNSPWSDEEKERVRKLWVDEGLSAGKIAQRTGRSRSAIMAKIHKWGLQRGIKSKRVGPPKRVRGPKMHSDANFIEPWADFHARKVKERQEARNADK